MSKVYIAISKSSNTIIGVYATKTLANQYSDEHTDILGPYHVYGGISDVPPNSPVKPIIFQEPKFPEINLTGHPSLLEPPKTIMYK